jgi:hypothetical protein
MARRTRNRLMVATLVGAVLVAVAVVAVEGPASSSPKLPPVAPDSLIPSVLHAAERHPPVSGRIVAHVDLGLPQFPVEGGSAATGPGALVASLAGDHVLRLWRSDGGARISELLPFSERSITVGRSDAWAWDSSTFTAYHLGPFPAGTSGLLATENPASLVDPLELARKSLAAITPTTVVSVGETARVAGRSVYTIVLEPRTSATLVGRIEVSVDAAERVPLRVAVFARGARKATLSVGFTSVSFAPISPDVYRFVPPPGATIVTVPRPGLEAGQGEMYASLPGGIQGFRTFGAGWSSVAAVRIEALPKSEGSAGLASFLPYSGPLFSIRLVQREGHEWLVYGAVPQSALAAVEPQLP